MRWKCLSACLGVMLSCTAWSHGFAVDGSGPVPPSSRPVAAAAHSARSAQGLLQRRQSEVKRLQHAVDAQESDSQRAAERLQQQDAAIAELRRQLQAAQAAGQH